MRDLLIGAAVICVAAFFGTDYLAEKFQTMQSSDAAPAQSERASNAAGDRSGDATIERGADGHFHLEARVDGRTLDFLVDTGATSIVLRAQDARRAGYRPSGSDYSLVVGTANGVVTGAPIELSEVRVNNIRMRNVSAIVLPDEALAHNLLGMSFLGRLKNFQMKGNRLILEN